MPFPQIFKRKREKVKIPKKIDEPHVVAEKQEKPRIPRKKKRVSLISFRIVSKPHITEKASTLAEKNQYVFEVFGKVTKKEVADSVSELYGVDVKGVHIINIPSKKIRLGRKEGIKKGYKKAIVKIRKDQKIEILPR